MFFLIFLVPLLFEACDKDVQDEYSILVVLFIGQMARLVEFELC
jgi:hypothetical protein